MGVYSFGILQQAALLDFLVLEKIIEQLEILFLQEVGKTLTDTTRLIFLVKVVIKFVVKEYSSVQVRRQFLIVALQKGYHFFNMFLAWTVFKHLFNEKVKYIAGGVVLLDIFDFLFRKRDQVVNGILVSFEPH